MMDFPHEETLKTKDIKKALGNFASERSIPLSMCSYSIEHLSTYMKTNIDDDFKLFNENISEYYKDKGEITNRRVEFKQVYTILIKSKIDIGLALKYSLDISSNIYKPTIILDPESYIPYDILKPQETFELLIDELDKIKAENHIIIELFDDSMIKTLKALTKYIYKGAFKKKVRILLFDGIEPEANRTGSLILLFKEKNNNQEIKHQIIEVEENEIIAEFQKPKFGKNGFNAFGEQVIQNYGVNTEDLLVPIDENTIYIEEDDDKKLYKSKTKGFVRLTNRLFSVENKLKRTQLSRIDDSIVNDEDNNIEVLVSQSDANKDSIGEGVELKSETIHVNGHIGANSTLEALNLRIDGATHSSSKQFAKTAIINRHKGILRCNDAKIKLLEGGVVHATKLEVESSIGGTIYAQDVTIGHVKSNLKVYASHSITIRLVSGEDNLFKIDYKDIPIINSKINFIEEEIHEAKFSLDEAKSHNQNKVEALQNTITVLKSEIKDIKESTLTAKITIDKPFLGLNTINFTLDNNDELIFKTQNRQYSEFYLETTQDDIILHPVNVSIPLKL